MIPSPAFKEHFSFVEGNDRGFYKALKSRVNQYFEETGQGPYANCLMVCKIVLYFAAFLGLYLTIILGRFGGITSLALAILFGWVNVLIVFNIGHDAAHEAISRNHRVNYLLGLLSINLVGGNAYIYGIVHNSPHPFPNVSGADVTLDQTGALIRLSPTMPVRGFHRYQHMYGPILYLSYSIFLIFLKDFRIFQRRRIGNIIVEEHPPREYAVLIISKFIYAAYAIALPLYVLPFRKWQVLIGFCCMHLGMGLFLTVVLQPVHLASDLSFEQGDANGEIHKHWALYQTEATKDFSPDSWFGSLFLGGLNTHVIHHLFPRICHVHYRALTRILNQTAFTYGVPYQSDSFPRAVLAHWKFLRVMGRRSNQDLATG